MIGRTLFVETFVQIWVLLDLSRMDVALTHYLLWVKSWQYNWLDRPLLFRHLAFRRGKALKKHITRWRTPVRAKNVRKRGRYFLCGDRDKCFITWSGHYVYRANKCNLAMYLSIRVFLIFRGLKYVGCSVAQTECWLSGKAEPPPAGQSFSVFTTTHQPTRLWKNEERKRKEWRSRFDPVGNLSGSAKLVSEKRVGSESMTASGWKLFASFLRCYSSGSLMERLLYGIHSGVI